MELSDLRLFQAIAEEGSISRAAVKLDYVQSNVTTRLRRLEEELGVLLFYRRPKGVQITEKGMLFRQYADSILQMADESIKILQDHGKPAGSLRIGVVETVTCGNFMNLIAEYQSQYEQVSLRLDTGNSLELMEKVKNYELDAAFVTGDLTSTNFVIDYLLSDEIVLLSGKELSLSSLSDQKWAVSLRGCPFRGILEQWFRDEGLTLRNYIEISSLETLLSSVRAKLTSTLLPKSVLNGSYKDLHVHPIPESYQFIETGLIRRKEKHLGYSYKAFVEMVKMQGL
ncbi:LysR family transcriptional regulator [Metabacillus arenae]|uniref:LysR family transcriptional regulator n=1 Tax=Metabacillus arenae TaxID=2771434 RepID=A0A926NJ32_9BACI|nr:LysR family transcriptional regulator [Metabacillus arenae]MBD1382000.1 LysR family transcriptional regulator [Metabacillus arenae]